MSTYRIIEAEISRGWGSCDHLISDRYLTALVGRTYQTLQRAINAAQRYAEQHGNRWSRWPVAICVASPDGVYRSMMVGSPTPHRETWRTEEVIKRSTPHESR